MATFVPSSDTGVTWRFKTLYARHLQLSRLEVMEEVEPGHPELQRLKKEISRKSSSSSSVTSSVTKRILAHVSLRAINHSQSSDILSIGRTPSIGEVSDATSEFPSTTGQLSATGNSYSDKNKGYAIPLRPRRLDFDDLEAEVLPTA